MEVTMTFNFASSRFHHREPGKNAYVMDKVGKMTGVTNEQVVGGRKFIQGFKGFDLSL